MKKNKCWPTLYKMGSTGAIQQWEISITPRLESWRYTITHGQINGKLQDTYTDVVEGKNIGKANETSVYEQCEADAQSLWNKQKDRKGYSEEIPDEKPLRPMLAKSYDKDGKHIKYPCYLQSKMDGLRCLAKRTKDGVELISRQGKIFNSLPHIEEQLMWLKEGQILDGELYIHGEEFQDIISAIKRDKPSEKSKDIEYHVYDVINDKEYHERLGFLTEHLLYADSVGVNKIYGIEITHIKVVNTYLIQNEKDVWKYHKDITAEGFEGVMLRNVNGPYKINGRSSDLQKVKKFIDMEFEIVGAEENRGKQKGQCTLNCVTKSGKEFGVKPKGSDEQRKQYWIDWKAGKLEGEMLTVRFFSWTTSDDPVPRFPVGLIVRNYEE